MTETRALTIGERIVVHLFQYARNQDAFVCPVEMSQAGIADSLGISRAHAAIELKRQMDAGRVVTRVAHVMGAPTRRKVYTLTPKGFLIADSVRARAAHRSVEVVGLDGRSVRMPGLRALETARRHGVREGRAVLLVLMGGRIDLRETSAGRSVGPVRAPEVRARLSFDAAFVRPVAWQLEVVLGPPHAPPVPAAA